MYDSDFVSTVKATCSLEWPYTRFVRMNSFQPTADETYDRLLVALHRRVDAWQMAP